MDGEPLVKLQGDIIGGEANNKCCYHHQQQTCKEISVAGKLKPFTHKPAHFLLLSTTNKQTNKQQTCSLVFLLLSTTNEQTTNLLTSVGIIINNKPAHCRCATITTHHHGTKVSSPKCCFRPWWEVLFAKRSIVKEGRQGDPLKNIRYLFENLTKTGCQEFANVRCKGSFGQLKSR